MKNLSFIITEVLVKKGVVAQENMDIYDFGLAVFFMKTLHIITQLLIGLVFGQLFTVLIFLCAYIPLRKYAGGYHAKTPALCYILSCLMVTMVVFINKTVFLDDFAIAAFSMMTFFIVLCMSPVEDANKPLDIDECFVYKKKVRVILLAEEMLIFTCLLLKFKNAAYILFISMFLVCVMLVIGYISNKIHTK